MMAYCAKCGTKLRASDRFCPGCGAPVQNDNPGIRQQAYEGTIHKCPNCGEPIGSFTSKCPTCGFEFRDVHTSSAVRNFAERLDQLQSRKKQPSTISSVAKTFGFGRGDNTEEQIVNTIKLFSVPNTKEDVFEFMILASSNIDASIIAGESGPSSPEELIAKQERNNAWIAKFEQVYQKAKLSFGNDPDFDRIEEIHLATTEKMNNAEKKKRRSKIHAAIALSLLMIIPILFFVFMGCSHASKERALEQTVQEIQIDISNGDYDSAMVKAQSLHMDDNYSNESKEHWDEQREALIELINEKKAGK